MRPLTIAAAGAILCIPASAQRPTADEQRALAAARDYAIHYTNKLPDFLCTEQMERGATTGAANFQVDRLTIQLGFSGQKEHYKLVTMNGRPATQSFASLDGLISRGEFGSQLIGIFDPAAAADFQWKESSTLRKRRVAVYTYRIQRAKSQRRAAGGLGRVIVTARTERRKPKTCSAALRNPDARRRLIELGAAKK